MLMAKRELESIVRRGSRMPGNPRIKRGSEASSGQRDRVLLENLSIVRRVARHIHRHVPRNVDIEDLVSAGVIGLIDASSKFDPSRNAQFQSYAHFRIRGAILDSLRALDWGPRELRRRGRAVEDSFQTLTARLGRTPSEEEISNEMGLPIEEYRELLRELDGLEIASLHKARNEGSSEDELANVPSHLDEDPLSCCMRGELRGRLSLAMADLPERERLVMKLYYYEEMTMREIGILLGVVESRISQIHSSAVTQLRIVLRDMSRMNDISRKRQNLRRRN